MTHFDIKIIFEYRRNYNVRTYTEQRKKLSMDARVLSYQTDRNALLKPSYALRFMQEAAAEHTDKFGYGTRILYDDKKMFILISVSINFEKNAVFERRHFCGNLELRSKRRTFSRVRAELRTKKQADFVRLFIKVGACEHRNASYFKTERSRRFQRGFVRRKKYDLRDRKIPLPKEMELVGEREIRYSDIDYNNHANNCAYADFVLDFIPCDMAEKRVDKLDIYFHSEALMGDRLKNFSELKKDGIYYF
ncbi:MAG: thioesterase [Clostridiales bacterium]|nr:MAG: thioesterase [Clostridiales bacterium]